MSDKQQAVERILDKWIRVDLLGTGTGAIGERAKLAAELLTVAGHYWTGLRDIHGQRINIGDRVRFLRKTQHDPVWEAEVIFEDGVYTVCLLGCKQVKNPPSWKEPHDWIGSRWWATVIGYGEYGSWNVPRQPLTLIERGFATYEQYRDLQEQFGYIGGRIINVEIVL